VIPWEFVLPPWDPSVAVVALDDGSVVWRAGREPVAIDPLTAAVLPHLDGNIPFGELIEDLAAVTGQAPEELSATVSVGLSLVDGAPPATGTRPLTTAGIELNAATGDRAGLRVLLTPPSSVHGQDQDAPAGPVLLSSDGTLRHRDPCGWGSTGSSIVEVGAIIWCGHGAPIRARIVASLLVGAARGNELMAIRILRRVGRFVESLSIQAA
jgi:hypothetical protein